LIPFHASSGVLLLMVNVGLLLRICTVQLTALDQNVFGMCFLESMLRTMFIIV
jgi:hypothetical protein